ncbi:PREDICTED: probable polygalacturonase At2g43860 [Tarenaya hassleriana]|uniref:probable polygalacturonase At2g43860 n=1 Tax=Tarenaya hassleriana TaxID=28532 RepID=UPI00053C8432|nr:PREDICTED: probable polygalacturonase At2g43860 [Tarenaya hassleriana]
MIHTTNVTFSLLLFVGFFSLSSLADPIPPTLDVLAYGAKPDGSTDSTNAFLAAWDEACLSANPTTIVVPQGRFLIGNVVFQGKSCKNTRVSIRIDGTIIAPQDYRAIAGSEKWISFEDVNGVSIFGGILDAQGTGLWNCKNNGNRDCPTGAKSLVFSGSKNIEINGLTSLNSQMFHVVIDSSDNVRIDGVRASAAGNSPNTDGIHVQSSSSVTVSNSRIGTGDDCISVGPGTSNLLVENIVCGPGHGISIGSLGKEEEENGVENVTVRNVKFTGTENGVRIKTWSRRSNGFARNIVFRHITMNAVKNPIIIDQNYCPNKPCQSNQESGVKISGVTYEDIHGTSATEVGITLDCSEENPCSDIKMDGVKLIYRSRPAEASCVNADGSANDVVPTTACL